MYNCSVKYLPDSDSQFIGRFVEMYPLENKDSQFIRYGEVPAFQYASFEIATTSLSRDIGDRIGSRFRSARRGGRSADCNRVPSENPDLPLLRARSLTYSHALS